MQSRAPCHHASPSLRVISPCHPWSGERYGPSSSLPRCASHPHTRPGRSPHPASASCPARPSFPASPPLNTPTKAPSTKQAPPPRHRPRTSPLPDAPSASSDPSPRPSLPPARAPPPPHAPRPPASKPILPQSRSPPRRSPGQTPVAERYSRNQWERECRPASGNWSRPESWLRPD